VPFRNLGISLATSLVSFYNFALLYIFLKKKTGYSPKKGTIREISRSLICGIILLITIFVSRQLFSENLVVILFTCAALTLIIYGFAFKKYYYFFLKKK